MHPLRLANAALCVVAVVAAAASPTAHAKGKLLIRVVDAETKAVLPFRIHLRNQAKVPVKVPQLPFWHDHVAAPGPLQLELLRGNYFFEIEHGPEYVNATGFFTLNDGADDEKEVTLKRACDMAAAGWWSGDLDVQRPLRELETAMAADDLHVVPLVASPAVGTVRGPPPGVGKQVVAFDGNRFYESSGTADDRIGGPVRWFGLPSTASTLGDAREPLSARVRRIAGSNEASTGAHIDVADAAAWDLPLLAATGRIDSIGLLSSQLRRDRVVPSAKVRPFDPKSHLPTTGTAEFAQEIYFQLLNCGLRIAPSAGSGSGAGSGPSAVGNPVGYNRLYVQVSPQTFDVAAWWEGLRDGRVVVTNGPLIRPTANQQPPGFVFAAATGGALVVEPAMELTTRDKVSYVEVIRDGRVVQTLPLRDWARGGGRFAPLSFETSGWFLIRVRCEVPETYRMAMSAPWYVDFDGKPRVSRAAVKFFQEWLDVRAAKLEADKSLDPELVSQEIARAREFWNRRAVEADAP